MSSRSAVRALVRRVNVRHLSRRKLRSALTIAGIAAGVSLVFAISVIDATLLADLRSTSQGFAGDADLAVAAAGDAGIPTEVVEAIRASDGVEVAAPLVRTRADVTGASATRRMQVVGLTPDITRLASDGADLGLRISGGLGDGSGVLLSQAALEEVGARRGDEIAITTASGPRLATVTGTISGGPADAGPAAVLLLARAQEVLNKPRVDLIYVQGAADTDVAELQARLARVTEGVASVAPPNELGSGFEQTFSALSTLTSLAGVVALFVALFVVYNTMSMTLVERRQELALISAFGTSRRELFAATLGEAAVLGGVASLVGVAGGLGLAYLLIDRAVQGYALLPLSGTQGLVVDPLDVVIAAVGGLVVGLAGAVVPARRILQASLIEPLRPGSTSALGRGSRTGAMATSGVALVAVSLSLLVLYALVLPERRSIAVVAMLLGLSGVSLLLPLVVPHLARVAQLVLSRLGGPPGRLAGDVLLRDAARTTYTVGAVVLTLGMFVSVGSALGSYEAAVDAEIDEAFLAPLYVTASSFNGLGSDQPLAAALEQEIEQLAGVDRAYVQRYGSVLLEGERALVYALPVEDAYRSGRAATFVGIEPDRQDDVVRALQDGEVVISRLTAERRDLQTGDALALPTPDGEALVRVAGVFDDLASFDTMYLDLATYQRLFDDDRADRFAVIPESGAEVTAVADELDRFLRTSGVPGEVLSRTQLAATILGSIKGLFSVARGIQAAALVVAVLTILNTMVISVLERRWEGALSQALGMTPGELRRQVVLEAAAMGAIGAVGAILLGNLLGLAMTRIMEAQFSWRVPFVVPWDLTLLGLVAGVVLAAAAAIGPSRLATGGSLVGSLRYE